MFFKKKKYEREEDRVWGTTDLKWAGMVDDLIRERNQYPLMLAVAHFKRTADEMRKQFQARNVVFKDYDESFGFHPGGWKEKEGRPLLLVRAERLSEMETLVQSLEEVEMKNREVLIVVAEHHPLKEGDEVILSFLSRLSCRSKVRFYCALDEPLFKYFEVGRVLELLKNLGWNEKDYISHSAFRSAIEKAQEKIKQKVKANHHVDSAEDWFSYHIPSHP